MEEKNRAAQVKSESYFASVWTEFRKNRAAVVGMAILSAIILAAIFADMLAPCDPYLQVYAEALQPPSAAHLGHLQPGALRRQDLPAGGRCVGGDCLRVRQSPGRQRRVLWRRI